MCSQGRDEDAELIEARARVERMVQRYLSQGRYALNPDPVTVEHVLAGLARNLVEYGRWYCPCREVLGDPELDRSNICPCPQHHGDIARDGACECGLFVNHEFAQAHPAGATTKGKEES